MSVTSFRVVKLSGGSPCSARKPPESPGLSGEAIMAKAEEEREREKKEREEVGRQRRESTHYSVVQVLGPKPKSAQGLWVCSPATQWACQATVTECWTEAPLTPLERPSPPAVSTKVPFTRHFLCAGPLHSLLHSSCPFCKTRIISILQNYLHLTGLRSEIRHGPTASRSLSASAS